MKTYFLAGSLAMLFLTPSAHAQCATAANTGGGNCVPPDAPGMPGYSPDRGDGYITPPVPVWENTWGAIAIDSTTGNAGTVTGRASRREAEQAAMRDCASKGARDCELMESYYNQCAAVAWGHAGYGTARDATEAGAQARATGACDKTTSQCKVVYSACSVARRVQ